MVMKRMQRKMNDEGVSEVLGSILTLSITVIIFSSVFVGIQNLQTPEESIHTKFEISYDITSVGTGNPEESYVYHINITNVGGSRLEASNTELLLRSEDEDDGTSEHLTYLADSDEEDEAWNDFEDGTWNMGSTFYIRADKETNVDMYDELIKDTKVTLRVIDLDEHKIVWQDVVKKQGDIGPIVRRRGVDYAQSWKKAADPGETVTLYAYVVDKHNRALNVSVNRSELEGFDGDGIEDMEVKGPYKPLKENRYEVSITIDDQQDMGSYLLRIIAENDDGFISDSQYIVLNVGDTPVSEQAELKVDPDRITTSPSSPVNGDDIIVTATIYNVGGGSTRANVSISDEMPNGTEMEIGHTNVSFPAGGGRDVRMEWTINGGGTHRITVDAESVENGIGDRDSRNLTVIPKILLIDDDPEMTGMHDPTVMRNALNALDLDFDTYDVGGGNGPSYEDLLVGYDIAIWMTGDQTEETLTESDRDNLEEFLENGNKLWLIGEGILEDPEVPTWIESNLNAIEGSTTEEIVDPLRGGGEPLSDEDVYNVSKEIAGQTSFITSTGDDAWDMLIDDDGDGETIAVSNEGDENRRTVFQHMLFGSIQESITAGRTRLASQVINWMGNVTEREVTDLSITHQEFDNPNPNYMDTVTVSGIIRNNSPEPLSTDVTLEVNGRIYDETHIDEILPGETIPVEFEWLADEVGEHEIMIIVDPYDRVEESTTHNNDIRYTGQDVTLDVSFTTLFVDGETGDGDRGPTTEELVDIYDDLGYVNEIYDVNLDQDDEGPLEDYMREFNSVVWLTGERGEEDSETELLTESNIDNITEYHEEYISNFMLVGDYVLEDLEEQGHDGFIEDVLNIDPDSLDHGTPEILKGVEDHSISHGMRYHLEGDTGIEGPSYYEPLDGETVFEDSEGNTYAHTHHDNNYRSRVVHMGVDLMHFDTPIDTAENEEQWYEEYDMNVSSRAMRAELMYLTNSWFGLFDDRVELRVTEEDLKISNKHPFVGESFELTALIHNDGGAESEVLVRFKDGNDHIKSKSMYVPPHGSADVEIKWEPENAGDSRPIRIIVDPLHEIAEVPNEPGEQTEDDLVQFNNQAIIYTPVYYFWDDMENGSDYWSHEAQLARINGGNPLDFLSGDYEDVNTDVAHNWSETKNVTEIDWDTHSDPKSYFMQEPIGKIGREADALVSIVIDNSFSMGDRTYEGESWLWHAKQAAKFLVNDLSNESRVGVWSYDGTDPNPIITPPIKLEDNRDSVIQDIDDIESNPQAPVYDTVGNAYTDVIDMKDDYSELEPAVIMLTDGADKMAADDAAQPPKFELGSEDWAPWHEMESEDGGPMINYDQSHIGKYRFDYRDDPDPYEPGEWDHVGDQTGQGPGERKGLLNSSIPIFTIGMGVEHNFDLDDNPEDPDWNSAPDLGSAGDDNYLVEKDPNDKRTWESGTTEYNLWRIATTSDALYFYAPDPEDLEDIFESISDYISGPQNLTSVESPTPSSSDQDPTLNSDELTNFPHTEEENTDKYAVTPTLNLQNMSEAWLSFYHKYRIIQGVNGAYLEIGHINESDQREWQYVQPALGQYTGNLLLDDLPQDDSGREIKWAWNGKSGGGTLQWDFVRLNIMNYLDRLDIPEDRQDDIKVRFYYNQFGGSTVPGGWIIDDVSITASRNGDNASNIEEGIHDVWQMNQTTDRYGDPTTAWWNGEPDASEFRSGIDNSLTTTSIDLSDADTAIFDADFKFNINTESGIPPDVVRTEITTDGGKTWGSINTGVRMASGVSEGTNSWTSADDPDMWRLNVDLSGYSGETIRLRFRVATSNDEDYDNYEEELDFGGFYVDNVVVSGETVGS
ncbi:MAG: CARDB domain-containing protein [Candidatus Saliniplasma sp.]